MQEKKEWTLMFYLASDNPLAPGVVSQLKALKSAGFHPDVNVVTQFDPYVEGTPTHVFEVNLLNKIKQPGVANVGFAGNDPFVRDLVEDKLWREQKTRASKPLKSELRRILKQNHDLKYEAPTPPVERLDVRRVLQNDSDELDPQDSLRAFLTFCRTAYPAKHFALFILGHGVVVGNDVFLFDEHSASRHTISLTELGDVLRDFKTDCDESEFELVSFHSCSVSSLEVAFELEGTANYMLASQGPAFVGSWPYRSILIRIFNDVIRQGSHIDIRTMFHKIFQLCFFNAVDFLLAGYSFQLTLINLNRVLCIRDEIGALVEALLDGLKDGMKRRNPLTGQEVETNENQVTQDVIQLAHLKSQSFFEEMYTDLYDFCFCITQKVEEMEKRKCDCDNTLGPCNCIPDSLRKLVTACNHVMDKLIKEFPHQPGGQKCERIIISSEFMGPAYQYSRGLSVYFPWTRPIGDRRILTEYAHYRFHQEYEPDKQHVQQQDFNVGGAPPIQNSADSKKPEHSWLTFLETYFDATLRQASSAECDPRRVPPGCSQEPPPCPHDPPCEPAPPIQEPKPCDPRPLAQTAPRPATLCEKESQERDLKEDIANLIYGDEPSFGSYELEKTDPKDRTGGSDTDCPSIKNYPRDTRPRRKRAANAQPEKEQPRIEFTQAEFLL